MGYSRLATCLAPAPIETMPKLTDQFFSAFLGEFTHPEVWALFNRGAKVCSSWSCDCVLSREAVTAPYSKGRSREETHIMGVMRDGTDAHRPGCIRGRRYELF